MSKARNLSRFNPNLTPTQLPDVGKNVGNNKSACGI
jgi:hypothetical protein